MGRNPRSLLLCFLGLCTLLVACSDSTPSTNDTSSPSSGSSEVTTPSRQDGFTQTAAPTASIALLSPETLHEGRTGTGIPVPPDRDLAELARRLRLKSTEPISSIVGAGLDAKVGKEESFWVMDMTAPRALQVSAVLRLMTPHANWYVQSGAGVSEQSLKSAARAFEEQIYPRVTAVFGEPKLSEERRLTILHSALRGAAGYFGGETDSYPQEVHPFSNQRPVIYLSVFSLPIGGPVYLAVLAHELQHAIHGDADPTEETWVNEGLSELAAEIAGYRTAFQDRFLRQGTVSLTRWPLSSTSTPEHYNAASLFFRYLTDHYGGLESLRRLLQEPQDGAAGLNAYLQEQGATFEEVFWDWTVANLLGSRGTGRYSYSKAITPIPPHYRLKGSGSVEGTVRPFAASYVELAPEGSSATVRFQGHASVPIIPTNPISGDFCWWGNLGDSIHSRLTRTLDLRDVRAATLEFQAWYDIEEDWDYAYVTVSLDGGRTWEVLEGKHTVTENPVGNSFGPGLTGASRGWVQEHMDLTPFAGSQVLLGFEYITDDATHSHGLCLDDIAVPEIDFFDDAESDTGWLAEGFVRTNNSLPQRYLVQVVEYPTEGEPRVRQVTLDADNAATFQVEGFGDELERAVVVIASVTPVTGEATSYILTQSGKS